jgi:hypothetical protein
MDEWRAQQESKENSAFKADDSALLPLEQLERDIGAIIGPVWDQARIDFPEFSQCSDTIMFSNCLNSVQMS